MKRDETPGSPTDPRTVGRKTLGRWGEDFAAQYLTENGCLIMDRNWRCRDGEIDLIAWDSPEVVICEVRTRRGHCAGSALESITPRKLRRLRRLATAWLLSQDRRDLVIRIDAIGIHIGPDGRCLVEHLRGVG